MTALLCACGCGGAAPIAARSDSRRGAVKGQPVRFIVGHANRGRVQKLDRYHVEDRGYATPCWIWQLGTGSEGYGVVKSFGRRMQAHRFYYEERFGPIGEGFQLDHLCRVRLCVNPDHLEPVTAAENTRRSTVAKLSAEDVAVIRASSDPYPVLARRFGVTANYIYRLRAGEWWVTS